MSGPCPVLAATDAFGWMSSNDSFVMFILVPVAFEKASTIFMKAASSASTKRFQRSTLRVAFGSGLNGDACAQAFAKSRRLVAPARPTAAPPFNTLRRSNCIKTSPFDCWAALGRRCCALRNEALPGLGIEKMHEVRIRADADGLARVGQEAVAEDADHLL